MKKIFAADIGGTNSRFGYFYIDANGDLKMKMCTWLPTKEAGSFFELIEQLTAADFTLSPEDADMAVIAVAGPVERGSYSSPPLIEWDIDLLQEQQRPALQQAMLINDFLAQAYACRSPIGKEAEQILPGTAAEGATIAVIGAGTGLGKAMLVPDSAGQYLAVPSEGGHMTFPFTSTQEYAFQEFLKKTLKEENITGNTVVSGSGLAAIHRFTTGEDLTPEEVTVLFPSAPETLAWASRFYARVCKNYALDTLSMGGLYIAGGVAAKVPELLTNEEFKKEFYNSTTMKHILEQIPVFLISNENSGLWGAAFLGYQKVR